MYCTIPVLDIISGHICIVQILGFKIISSCYFLTSELYRIRVVFAVQEVK
jgi:hypothetical protein